MRGRPVWRLLGAALLAMLLLVCGLRPAWAAGPSGSPRDKFLQGSTVTIPAGETVSHDLYVTGGTVRIDGRVDGDLLVAGGTATLTGPVSGNLFVAGGTVALSGPVAGDLFVAGGNVTVASSIDRHLRVAGGNVTVSGPVNQDLLAASGTLELTSASRVGGDLIFAAGRTNLNGAVAGSVLGSAQTYEKDGSIGGSEDVTLRQTKPEEPASVLSRLLDQLRRYISILLVGLLLIWLGPRLLAATAGQLRERPLPSLGIGVVAFLGFFAGVLALLIGILVLAGILGVLGLGQLLLMVVLGLLLAGGVLAYLFVLILLFFAAAVVGIALGRLILGQVTAPWAEGPYVALLLGVLIVVILTALPLAGGILNALVVLFGLGALMTVLWHNRRLTPETPASGTIPAS